MLKAATPELLAEIEAQSDLLLGLKFDSIGKSRMQHNYCPRLKLDFHLHSVAPTT